MSNSRWAAAHDCLDYIRKTEMAKHANNRDDQEVQELLELFDGVLNDLQRLAKADTSEESDAVFEVKKAYASAMVCFAHLNAAGLQLKDEDPKGNVNFVLTMAEATSNVIAAMLQLKNVDSVLSDDDDDDDDGAETGPAVGEA